MCRTFLAAMAAILAPVRVVCGGTDGTTPSTTREEVSFNLRWRFIEGDAASDQQCPDGSFDVVMNCPSVRSTNRPIHTASFIVVYKYINMYVHIPLILRINPLVSVDRLFSSILRRLLLSSEH